MSRLHLTGQATLSRHMRQPHPRQLRMFDHLDETVRRLTLFCDGSKSHRREACWPLRRQHVHLSFEMFGKMTILLLVLLATTTRLRPDASSSPFPLPNPSTREIPTLLRFVICFFPSVV
jgi:hypothetical protein